MSDKLVVGVVVAFAGILVLIVVLTVVVAFLIALVWGWVIPDVFSGAVEQGFVSASISLFQALKLSVLLSVLGLTGNILRFKLHFLQRLDE